MPEDSIKVVLTIFNQNGAHQMSFGDYRSRHMERLLQLASGVDHWGGGQEAARQAPRLTWATWLGGGCHEQGAVARAVHHWGGGRPLRRIRGRHVANVRLLYHHHSWSLWQSSMNNVAHYLKKDCHQLNIMCQFPNTYNDNFPQENDSIKRHAIHDTRCMF